MNQNKQILNDQPEIPANMIDEYYIPQRAVKQPLQTLVEQEMVLAGLDPTKEEDVKKYWLGKGIGNA